MSTADQIIERLRSAYPTPTVAIAIARGPNSRAEAVSTQGVVRVEAGPGQQVKEEP